MKRIIHLVTVVLVPIGLCALLEATVRMTTLEQTAVDRMTERLYPVPPGKEEGLFATRVYDPLLSWRLRPARARLFGRRPPSRFAILVGSFCRP